MMVKSINGQLGHPLLDSKKIFRAAKQMVKHGRFMMVVKSGVIYILHETPGIGNHNLPYVLKVRPKFIKIKSP